MGPETFAHLSLFRHNSAPVGSGWARDDSRLDTVGVILPNEPLLHWDDYAHDGGGVGLLTAREFGPDATIEEIEASGLRGRGGGGFVTALKWASLRQSGGGRHFVVANGAEGEPATFKDRSLMRTDPFRIIEGAAIAALAIDAEGVFIATKRSFAREVEILRAALLEFTETGLLDEIPFTLVEGPDDYLFGEEKALLEVIEGREPLPRQLPPWQHGLFATIPMGWESGSGPEAAGRESNPTLVNNVETLAAAAHIMQRGASWYRTMGTKESPGTIVTTVVGDVVVPGVHEVELGTPFSTVLDMCGGPRPGRRFKAALSGVSNAVVTAAHFDTPLAYEAFAAIGSGLGAAGFVVYDDSRSMVSVARSMSGFLARESCGQCPSCTRGCTALTEQLIEIGRGRGSDAHLGEMNALLRDVTDGNRCYLGTEEQLLVSSLLREFPEDFAASIEGTAGHAEQLPVPLIKDLSDDGTVTYAPMR